MHRCRRESIAFRGAREQPMALLGGRYRNSAGATSNAAPSPSNPCLHAGPTRAARCSTVNASVAADVPQAGAAPESPRAVRTVAVGPGWFPADVLLSPDARVAQFQRKESGRPEGTMAGRPDGGDPRARPLAAGPPRDAAEPMEAGHCATPVMRDSEAPLEAYRRWRWSLAAEEGLSSGRTAARFAEEPVRAPRGFGWRVPESPRGHGLVQAGCPPISPG